MEILVLVTSTMGNKNHLSPVSPFKNPFNMRILFGFLCRQISSKKYMSFNNSSGASSLLNQPQHSMITNTSRSLIYFLCSSEFFLPQYSYKSSSIAFSACPGKPKFFLLILLLRFLFLLMNLSNHVPLVGLVFYQHISICDCKNTRPKSQDSITPNI